MRILMVTYGSLLPEHGAPQVALNLAGALRARGHEVVSWSTGEPPAGLRWWGVPSWQRREIERHAAAAAPYDAIDLPPVAVSSRLAAAAPLIARSTQPDLRYFAVELGRQVSRIAAAPLSFAAYTGHNLRLLLGVVRGWRQCRLILCLGSHEADWMARRAPWTRRKLAVYYNTPSPADQELFARLRRDRRPAGGPGTRYLWIGRWVAHKGTGRLVRFLSARLAESPHDSFTIAGCGPAAAAELPAALRQDERVRVIPAFTRGELGGLLAGHDAGLFTSRVEGWGLCLNEMLEAGLPVFATPAGAVGDLAPFFPRTLRTFPPPLSLDLAGLGTDDPELTGYYEHFTWDRIAERYEALVGAATKNR
jgi:glycosyltransferase involved in cell wall biosynthesis